MLIDMAVGAELFHTANGTAFADLMIDGHRETWPIRGAYFRFWLKRRYYESTGAAPSADAIRSALDLLEARVQFDGPQRTIDVRIAEHGGCIYLDLADEHWQAVEIRPDGWQVITCPPVRFRRAAGMLQLPVPVKGGSIEGLASFLNLPDRNDFVLVVAWLLAALRHGGPYPLLAVSGEQGSAKTVLSKVLRALIDPNAAPVRTGPREERDLFIAANNGYLLTFDNLSGLSPCLSDALCRLASGGSFAMRLLYTNLRAYEANCRAAIESVVEADPVAARVREIMAWRTSWTGNASDLLLAGADASADDGWAGRAGWPKTPRALAGRLRRAQTSLRALGIEIASAAKGEPGRESSG
jgi:hypothetical protein